MSVLTTLPSIGLTIIGAKESIEGLNRIAEGDLLQGGKSALVGLTAINIGTRISGLGNGMQQELMRYSIFAGSIVAAGKGIQNIGQGVQERSYRQTLKGIAQTGMGIAGAIYIDRVNSKIILVAHQASILTLTSCYIAKSGIHDIAKGNYAKGASKVVLGAGGIVATGYYIYSTCRPFFERLMNNSLTTEQSAFLKDYELEINQMFDGKIPGQWNVLGEGALKRTYTHPQLPGSVIKMPRVYAIKGKNYDIERDYLECQNAGKIALEYSRIRVPACSLETIRNELIVVEEKFEFVAYSSVPSGPAKAEAEAQLSAFLIRTGLCDIFLPDHNAAFLKGSEANPQIGLYDFDCNDYSSPQVPGHQAHQNRARLITIGASTMPVIAQVTKLIAGIEPAKIVMAVGAIVGLAAGIYEIGKDSPLDGESRVEAGMRVAGACAGLGSLVFATAWAIKVCANKGIRHWKNMGSFDK